MELGYRKATLEDLPKIVEIYNQIRAFIFPEYQLPMVLDRKIWKVRLFDKKIEPCLISDIGGKILISGIDGFLIEAFYG